MTPEATHWEPLGCVVLPALFLNMMICQFLDVGRDSTF